MIVNDRMIAAEYLFSLRVVGYLFFFFFFLPLQWNPQEELLLVTTETGVDIGDCCRIAESPQVGSKTHHRLAGEIVELLLDWMQVSALEIRKIRGTLHLNSEQKYLKRGSTAQISAQNSKEGWHHPKSAHGTTSVASFPLGSSHTDENSCSATSKMTILRKTNVNLVRAPNVFISHIRRYRFSFSMWQSCFTATSLMRKGASDLCWPLPFTVHVTYIDSEDDCPC